MKIIILSGAGSTYGDSMDFSVIENWLHELGVSEIILNPISIPNDARGIIIGGGGIIYDEDVCLGGNKNPYIYQDYILSAKNKSIPVIGLGLGWQGLPLGSGKKVWIENLNSMEFLTTRNKQTANYLKEIGVSSKIIPTTAPAFGLLDREVDIPEYDVGLLTHPPFLVTNDCFRPEWKDWLSIFLEKLCDNLAQNYSVRIITFCPFFNDEFEKMRSKNIKFTKIDDSREILGTIKKSKFCITITLHALISAAVASRKILALYPPKPLKPKIRWMAERLKLRRLPIGSSLDRILNGFELSKNDPTVNINKEIMLNNINKEMLKTWLEKI